MLVPLVAQSAARERRCSSRWRPTTPTAIRSTYCVISGLPAGATVQPDDRPVPLDPSLRPGRRLHDPSSASSDPGGLTDQTRVKVHVDNVDRPPTLVVSNHQAVVGQPLELHAAGQRPRPGTDLDLLGRGHARGGDARPQHRGLLLDARPGQPATTSCSSRSPTASSSRPSAVAPARRDQPGAAQRADRADAELPGRAGAVGARPRRGLEPGADHRPVADDRRPAADAGQPGPGHLHAPGARPDRDSRPRRPTPTAWSASPPRCSRCATRTTRPRRWSPSTRSWPTLG